MRFSPILLLHICAGTLGVLSGAVAAVFRKGSNRHRIAGNVFVIAMLALSATGVYLGFAKDQVGNVPGGALTFYLVATGWMTARRRNVATGIFDWGALLMVVALGAVTVTWELEAAKSPTGMKYGYPIGPYFFLGVVALIAFVGDVRMIVRGGISGGQRLARHLWRTCFALFIASASVFLARPQLFPALLQKTGVLILLSFLPLLLMIFWLFRVRFTSLYKEDAIRRTNGKSPQFSPKNLGTEGMLYKLKAP
jgi:hypothetical protein